MSILDKIANLNGGIAVLIDPDKTQTESAILDLLKKAEFAGVSFIFIGGSVVSSKDFNNCISIVKANSNIPVVIFPGGSNQISDQADGLLFLSLISGRNPDFLIGHHVQAAQEVFDMEIEVIPTGYVLIDGGVQSSVAYVSQTNPIPAEKHSIILNTCKAGILSGKKAIFLDAGSGALNSVPSIVIEQIAALGAPLIVGGGIKTIEQYQELRDAGANLIVIGNALEENTDFLLDVHSELIAQHGK